MIGLAILAGFGLLSAVVWTVSKKLMVVLAACETQLYCLVQFHERLVRIMDERDKVKLPDEVVQALTERAGRKFSNEAPADSASYQEGLRDGETITAQYVLGQLKEESE